MEINVKNTSVVFNGFDTGGKRHVSHNTWFNGFGARALTKNTPFHVVSIIYHWLLEN